MIYLLLFLACITVELSQRIYTENIINKIGIGFIAIGALVEYSGHNSHFIEIGILTYFTANIINAYLLRHKRRGTDK